MLGVRRRGGGVVAGTGGLVRAMEDAARPASIGTRENFFQLGGDSLSLTRMVLAAERGFALKVDFSRFLTNPTIDGFIAACAHRPDGATTTNDAVNRQEDAPYAADLAAAATLPAFTGRRRRQRTPIC